METKFSAVDHVTSPEQQGLVKITVGVILIAFIISGYYYFGPQHVSFQKNTFSSHTELELQSGTFPAQPIFSLTDKGPKTLLVEGQGTAILVGEGTLGTTTKYVLIMSPVTRSTELYQQNVANPKAGLVQLTQSGTQKVSLSVDTLSGKAAYLAIATSTPLFSTTTKPLTTASTTAHTATTSAVVTTSAVIKSHVVVWDPATKKETDFGLGTKPVLLPGGFFLILEREGKLISIQMQSKKETELITIPNGAVYAIDAKNLAAALYDPRSQSLQTFSLASFASLSFKASEKLSATPSAIVFDAVKPVTIYDSGNELSFGSVNGKILYKLPGKNVPSTQALSNQLIFLRHD